MREERDRLQQDSAELLPPPPAAAPSFRFETPSTSDERRSGDYTAGLDERDQELLRKATLFGGRALTLITLGSLIFYIYIGLSGGITDGFDRFSERVDAPSNGRSRCTRVVISRHRIAHAH